MLMQERMLLGGLGDAPAMATLPYSALDFSALATPAYSVGGDTPMMTLPGPSDFTASGLIPGNNPSGLNVPDATAVPLYPYQMVQPNTAGVMPVYNPTTGTMAVPATASNQWLWIAGIGAAALILVLVMSSGRGK